jgi:hypothetical protein
MKALTTSLSTDDYREGQRVQLHPGTDRWMRGDRYGTVLRTGRKYVRVLMDRSGHTIRVAPENLLDAS